MRRLLSILALLLPFALVVGAERASAQTFEASLFYVEKVGDFWVYRVNGVQDATLQVVGIETIGGVPGRYLVTPGGRSKGLKRTVALTRLYAREAGGASIRRCSLTVLDSSRCSGI
jgi:hypothetical protein